MRGLKVLSYQQNTKIDPAFLSVSILQDPIVSWMENRVYLSKNLGRQLAIEHNIQADVIVPIPDSGVPAAIGYSQQSGIPFETGIIRNHYIGRTFIEPSQTIRQFGVKLKHSVNRSVIEGKRVILIDDSIVRGTTANKVVKMVYEAGAKEVHLGISSPPIEHPDFYGIDTIIAAHSIQS